MDSDGLARHRPKVDARLFQELRWRSIGPRRRTALAVTGVRGQPEVYYFGAVGGAFGAATMRGGRGNRYLMRRILLRLGDCGSTFECTDYLCGNGRGRHALEHFLWEWDVQVADGGKTWTHIGLEDTRQMRGLWSIRATRKSICGCARTCVRRIRSGRFLFEGWREEVEACAFSRRKHGRD